MRHFYSSYALNAQRWHEQGGPFLKRATELSRFSCEKCCLSDLFSRCFHSKRFLNVELNHKKHLNSVQLFQTQIIFFSSSFFNPETCREEITFILNTSKDEFTLYLYMEILSDKNVYLNIIVMCKELHSCLQTQQYTLSTSYADPFSSCI